jgi:RimJ/RimL family protein N-acetyltransferase
VEDSHTPVGYVQFTHVAAGAVSHWGFYTRPDAPKGSGKKLGFTAINYAFNQLRLHKVCGQAIASNKASIGFHQSLGFQQEGLLREQQPIDDTYHSLICFGLLAHEWPSVSHAKESHHANY